MTFRNRYVLAGGNGLINLSIPLVAGRNQRILFKDVQIANDERWQLTHWRTITSCYNKSPYFEHYRESLSPFFSNRWQFLFDWNLSTLDWLRGALQFPAEIIVAESFQEEVEDLRNNWLPKNFQKDSNVIRYPQVFEDRIGFQQNLSILDMLFNVGPQAAGLLRNSSYL